MFVQCLRNWNKYLNSDEPDITILFEWEEIILKDFLKYSREWLFNGVDCQGVPNYDSLKWKEGLE